MVNIPLIFLGYKFFLGFLSILSLSQRRFYDLYSVSSRVAEGVVAESRVSTNTRKPLGLKLSDRPWTFCTRENTFMYSKL